MATAKAIAMLHQVRPDNKMHYKHDKRLYALWDLSLSTSLSLSPLSSSFPPFAELLFMRLKKFLIDLISNAINSHNMQQQQRDE